MSTKSCVIVKVRKEDLGKVMKFKASLLGVPQDKWEGDSVRDKCKDVSLEHAYIGIYCHWDGYPDGVGAALKENFSTYEKALNLVLGGSCSYIAMNGVKRYATRKGEQWKYLKPAQDDELDNVMSYFDWSEYAYLFDGDKWLVNAFDGNEWVDF